MWIFFNSQFSKLRIKENNILQAETHVGKKKKNNVTADDKVRIKKTM